MKALIDAIGIKFFHQFYTLIYKHTFVPPQINQHFSQHK